MGLARRVLYRTLIFSVPLKAEAERGTPTSRSGSLEPRACPTYELISGYNLIGFILLQLLTLLQSKNSQSLLVLKDVQASIVLTVAEK